MVRLRPDSGHRLRCPECGGKCRFYDSGEGRRRWRALDLGVLRCYLEADAPRVRCPRHGVLTAAVPWARPAARFTIAFEEQAAWLCAQMPWSKAARLLRVTWRALQSVAGRVVTGLRGGKDRLDGVRRIGIDEKAWRKGHRYITVVIDHDAGRIIWAAEGRNKETLTTFFDDLGEERAELLTHVSCDGAGWIHDVVREKAPGALICLDAFHVVKWAGERLDELRRRLASDLRAAGKGDQAAALGSSMWALRKNPAGLSPRPAAVAGADRRRQQAALQGVPDERAAPRGVQGQGRAREGAAGGAHRLVPALPDSRVHRPGKNPEAIPGADLEHPGPRRQQRPRRRHQHPARRPHRPRQRIPQRRSLHRHGRTHLRRPAPICPDDNECR